LINTSNGELGQFASGLLSAVTRGPAMLMNHFWFICVTGAAFWCSFLMDKPEDTAWMVGHLPRERRLMTQYGPK